MSHHMRVFASRSGRASDLAMAYGGTALVLAALGIVLIRLGATHIWPRHVDFGLLVLACAVGAGVYALINRQRALTLAGSVRQRLRLAEKMIGTFPAQLVNELTEDRRSVPDTVVLVITSHRVMLYRPDTGLDETFEHELDEVVSVSNLGPVENPSHRASVMMRLEFEDRDDLTLTMNLATAHELMPLCGTHLVMPPRQMRVIILEADGPIPVRADQELATILDKGKPALRQLVLDDCYLRILNGGVSRLGELWWYFHWEHMQVSPLRPVTTPGVPEEWLQLRMAFHGRSFIVVCGRPTAMRRAWDKALAGGATTVSPDDS